MHSDSKIKENNKRTKPATLNKSQERVRQCVTKAKLAQTLKPAKDRTAAREAYKLAVADGVDYATEKRKRLTQRRL